MIKKVGSYYMGFKEQDITYYNDDGTFIRYETGWCDLSLPKLLILLWLMKEKIIFIIKEKAV